MCITNRTKFKGVEVDRINAILSAAGMNSWKLLKKAADFFLWLQLFQRAVFCYIHGKM